MKKYSVLLDDIDKDGNALDNVPQLQTDDLKEADEAYNQLVEEIKKYDYKLNGASLMINYEHPRDPEEYESYTLKFFTYVSSDNFEEIDQSDV